MPPSVSQSVAAKVSFARMLRDLISRYNNDGGGKMQQMERDLEELLASYVALSSTAAKRP